MSSQIEFLMLLVPDGGLERPEIPDTFGCPYCRVCPDVERDDGGDGSGSDDEDKKTIADAVNGPISTAPSKKWDASVTPFETLGI